MKNNRFLKNITLVILLSFGWGCQLFKQPLRTENKNVPSCYQNNSKDTLNSAHLNWHNYFSDKNLIALIDTALKNNQELNITRQEIEIARNEIRAKKGEYLPVGAINLNGGIDKSGKHTWNGQSEEAWKETNSKPTYVGDFQLGLTTSWELDVWKKLRNSKNAALARYLGSVEGKNYMVTNLISEISGTYYELIALDNQLALIFKNIEIQQSALNIVKQQKDAARVTQLAVNRFEAQLINTRNLQYGIQQQIIETENKLNFLTGRFPAPIIRNDTSFYTTVFDSILAGVPVQLLENRPDIKQAEHELTAAKLDVKVAKAKFFPSLGLSGSAGFQAFNPSVWFQPAALLYNLSSELIAPVINRNGLTANYKSSRSKQEQAVLKYEQTVLNALIEVQNQLSGIANYSKSYATKNKEVEILTQSIAISDNLFKSARADYGEVLLTQREALDSKMELIELKKLQLNAEINAYKALGGGWK